MAKHVFYYSDSYVVPAFLLKSGRAREFVHSPITSTAWGITFKIAHELFRKQMSRLKPIGARHGYRGSLEEHFFQLPTHFSSRCQRERYDGGRKV